MNAIQIRALIFRDSGVWCAQCLEYDIAVQATSKAELLPQLMSMLSDYLEMSIEQGHKPFDGIPQAPQQFFDMFERSADWQMPVPALVDERTDAILRIVPTLRYLQPEPA